MGGDHSFPPRTELQDTVLSEPNYAAQNADDGLEGLQAGLGALILTKLTGHLVYPPTVFGKGLELQAEACRCLSD